MATLAAPPTPQALAAAPIELAALTHSYGDRVALDHLSFTVAPAEIFGLLGPNGSGKTTLFRILSTLMVPTGGNARIFGYDAATQPNLVRQQIGIVFQARSVDLKLTVAENLRHQGHLYSIRGAKLKARISEVLSRVGLLDRANDFVETLSGGMQRRVELAKGLIHSPQILLLDEPSTGLDPGARRDLWQYLRTLRDEEGVSVLVTTHLMEEAEHCDRLAILNTGKLVGLGSPAELKSSIGGDIVIFQAKSLQTENLQASNKSGESSSEQAAQSLALRIRQQFQVDAAIVGSSVRIERHQGHHFLTEVVEAFPGQIDAVSVAKPSLEDVFIQRTGHRFWTDADTEAATSTRKGK